MKLNPKLILKFILLIIATLVLIYLGMEMVQFFVPVKSFSVPAVIPMPSLIGMEAGPIKVNINESTPWESIVKMMSTVLGTYLGFKIINKYVK
jgi:carbon starvation protein CstA